MQGGKFMNQKNSRRQFLKGAIGGLGGLITARIAGLFPEAQPVFADLTRKQRISVTGLATPIQVDVGELYAGFLLLPENTQAPAFVQYPKLGVPIFCGVGDGPSPTASTISFNTDIDLVQQIDFPIYSLENLPDKLGLLGGDTVSHPTGDVYSVTIRYGINHTEKEFQECVISLWAFPDYPRPFPLWYSNIVEVNEPRVALLKVDFLPAAGIESPTENGYVFYWIENDVLYSLILEPCPDIAYALTVIDSLRPLA
jgi:hypothetical protein